MKWKKKKLWMALLLAGAMAAAGCGSASRDTAAEQTDEASGSTAEDDAGEDAQDETKGSVIKPLPQSAPAQASDEMPDGSYHAAFDGSSDVTEEDGALSIKLTFYEYDRYSREDMESLKEGDKIEHNGEVYTIEALEKTTDADGNLTYLTINGGYEEYGLDLGRIGEEETFRSILMNDAYDLYSIGTGQIPVSEEVEFRDYQPFDGPGAELTEEQIGHYAELQELLQGNIYGGNNTYVTIQNGEITGITVQWAP